MFASTSASTLTSPDSAMATPPLRSIRRTAALAASKSRSLHATRAPYRDSASAIPLPMFGPAPVTSATFPSSDTSTAPLPASLPKQVLREAPHALMTTVLIWV